MMIIVGRAHAICHRLSATSYRLSAFERSKSDIVPSTQHFLFV